MTMKKGYHALDIDFEIPEILEQDGAEDTASGSRRHKKIPERLPRYVKLILHG